MKNYRTDAAYLQELISHGEHQQQDFKFEISDARKIARSLSAFSNTEGGRLLVDVKDNGKIAGVRSEEEAYMIEAAAKLYCKPQVEFSIRNYIIENKTVLEVCIPEGVQKPYYARDNDNKYKAYLRIKDENILATAVHIRVWQLMNAPKGTFIHYSSHEQALLDYLNENERISLSQYCKLFSVPRFKAISLFAKLIRFDVIEAVFQERKFYFRLHPQILPTQ